MSCVLLFWLSCPGSSVGRALAWTAECHGITPRAFYPWNKAGVVDLSALLFDTCNCQRTGMISTQHVSWK